MQSLIRTWLEDCKTIFACTYDDDDSFGFFKFHTGCAHISWLIEEYGAFYTTCTGRMETEHQVAAKDPYKRTSRRHASYRLEMTKRLQEASVLATAAAVATQRAVHELETKTNTECVPWIATRDSWAACSALVPWSSTCGISEDMHEQVISLHMRLIN